MPKMVKIIIIIIIIMSMCMSTNRKNINNNSNKVRMFAEKCKTLIITIIIITYKKQPYCALYTCYRKY